MFTESLARGLVGFLYGYAAIGVVFALVFTVRGASAVDASAASGTRGFRVMIFPGCAAFWPLLLKRWMSGTGEPPVERNAHRDAASGADREVAR